MRTPPPFNFKWLAFGLIAALASVSFFATASAQGGDPSRGRQLFLSNCAVCHGENAEGRVGARLAKDFPGIRPDASIKETISNGVRGSVMPAWSKAKGGPLDDSQIDDLVAYIRSLGHQASPVPTGLATATSSAPTPSPVATFPPGDPNRGATVFARNCVVCHGDLGQGRIGATLAKDWPGINAESYIEATIARGVAGSKMPAWGQSSGGPLTPQDIADVAAYVRTLKSTGGAAPAESPPEAINLIAGPVGLACGVLVVIALIVVLGVGLAGRRSKQ